MCVLFYKFKINADFHKASAGIMRRCQHALKVHHNFRRPSLSVRTDWIRFSANDSPQKMACVSSSAPFSVFHFQKLFLLVFCPLHTASCVNACFAGFACRSLFLLRTSSCNYLQANILLRHFLFLVRLVLLAVVYQAHSSSHVWTASGGGISICTKVDALLRQDFTDVIETSSCKSYSNFRVGVSFSLLILQVMYLASAKSCADLKNSLLERGN
jgi:hypothetical protein